MYYLRAAGRYLRTEVFNLPSRVLVLLFIMALLLLPVITHDAYLLWVFAMTAILTIYAVSWDVLAGYAGQFSLGHALYFGVGAYASALLNMRAGFPPYLGIPLAGVLAMLAGLLAGVLCLRLRKHHLALATLSFPLMLTAVVVMFPDFTGGEHGIRGISRLAPSRVSEYYIAVGVMLTAVMALWKITTTRIGLIFHAIREDEVVVRALGINTVRYKLIAFVISGFVAGIAGGLFAHFVRVAGLSNLELFRSFQPVIWTIFGGAASIYGAVTGVFLLVPALEFLMAIPNYFPQFELLRLIADYRMIIFALMVLLILRFMPGGLAIGLRKRLEKPCPYCRSPNAFRRRTCRTCQTPLES